MDTDDTERTERTEWAIDAAYWSYHAAIINLCNDLDLPGRLRKELDKLRFAYDSEWAIDIRQNVSPIVEEPEKTILKACQYAQACLVRDLRRLYRKLMRVPELKHRAGQLLAVSPREISLQFAESGADFPQTKMTYLSSIRDPKSAATVIGGANSADSIAKHTAYHCLLDEVLQKRISQAEVSPSKKKWWQLWQ